MNADSNQVIHYYGIKISFDGKPKRRIKVLEMQTAPIIHQERERRSQEKDQSSLRSVLTGLPKEAHGRNLQTRFSRTQLPKSHLPSKLKVTAPRRQEMNSR